MNFQADNTKYTQPLYACRKSFLLTSPYPYMCEAYLDKLYVRCVDPSSNSWHGRPIEGYRECMQRYIKDCNKASPRISVQIRKGPVSVSGATTEDGSSPSRESRVGTPMLVSILRKITVNGTGR